VTYQLNSLFTAALAGNGASSFTNDFFSSGQAAILHVYCVRSLCDITLTRPRIPESNEAKVPRNR